MSQILDHSNERSKATSAGPAVPSSRIVTGQWSEAIRVPFDGRELPSEPAALVVKLSIEQGRAGVGWYDLDGCAEEVFVGPGPCTPTVYLSLWDPGRCQSLLVRNVSRAPLHVTLLGMQWTPLRVALKSDHWFTSLRDVGEGMFLELPFKDTLSEPLWRSWYDRRWDDPVLRLKRLRMIVSLAWRHCRGYRNWWKQHGWYPSDLQNIEDAGTIPAVSKEQIRADLDAFSLPRRNSSRSSTTGTTGQPFTFHYTASLRGAHQATVALAASLAAPGPLPWQMNFVDFCGRPVRGMSRTGAGGNLILSPSVCRHPELLGSLLKAYRPQYLFAFPSTASVLADAIEGTYRFRGAVIGSENILPAQIRAVERIAERVVATYGVSEGVSAALRCPSCGAYGELTSHGVTTLRARPDGLFDIIGTSFWALGTLFINYETGDVTTGITSPCPDCPPGGLRIADVQGRSQDSLIDQYGIPHTLGVVTDSRAVVACMIDVRLYDCLQSKAGHVVLRYVTGHGQPIDEAVVLRALQLVAPDLTFELQFEPQLEAMRDAQPRGTKWRLVKSTI